MIHSLRGLLADESGAVLVEYGVLMAVLALGSIIGLNSVANIADKQLTNTYAVWQDFQACPPGIVGCTTP